MTNKTHALLLNLSIPWEDGERSQCHVYKKNFSYGAFISEPHGNDPTNGSTIMPSAYRPQDVNVTDVVVCDSWVFDDSVFSNTISSDVSLYGSLAVLLG